MAKTETELATAVLKHLSVIGAGQSAEAADVADVIEAYRSKYAELAAPGLEYAYWDTGDNIPDEVFIILRDLVALDVQNAFGQALTAADRDELETIIMKRLRRHVGLAATGEPVVSEYF